MLLISCRMQKRKVISNNTGLLDIITDDYIFIDLPYYSIIGDAMIWKGTEEMLKSVPYRCLLRAFYQTF